LIHRIFPYFPSLSYYLLSDIIPDTFSPVNIYVFSKTSLSNFYTKRIFPIAIGVYRDIGERQKCSNQ
jgi:hypothetical protein